MKRTGEWGEFFPVDISPFAYNETLAQENFPLEKEDVMERGWKWKDVTGSIPEVNKIMEAKDLPDNISDISDNILDSAIECSATKKPFRITKAELKFYRVQGVPLPRKHPDQRHLDRIKLRNPYKLWERKCGKCGTVIQTTYAPDRPEIVYCEKCYLKEVY
jgi:hypothetical protein